MASATEKVAWRPIKGGMGATLTINNHHITIFLRKDGKPSRIGLQK